MGWWPFGRRKQAKEPVVATGVVIGGRYRFKPSDPSPWPDDSHFVQVLDAKDGWVRYSFGGSIFTDERRREKSFLSMYEGPV